jgi:flavodoxin/NAD-dependent dihydropyrimidine dehydrogenase PreA subunit
MKSAVIYFSQTGNTKRVAEAIQSGIALVTKQCGIFKLKETKPADLPRYDLIGLGCPVFAYREPANVRAFVESLPSLRGKHGFVFATHGTVLGKTLATMSWALYQKGVVVIGSYHCYADVFVPGIPYPWFTTGHPDETDLNEAEAFGRQMAELSQKITRGEASPTFKTKMTGWGQPLQARLLMTLKREKCRYPECRLCVDNCPMNGIDLSVEPFVFRRDCISCFFCEQVCPYSAIEVDWEILWSIGRPRWQAYQRAAQKAERQGLLRRYHEVEIDNPAKIRFKIFPTRPRITPR